RSGTSQSATGREADPRHAPPQLQSLLHRCCAHAPRPPTLTVSVKLTPEAGASCPLPVRVHPGCSSISLAPIQDPVPGHRQQGRPGEEAGREGQGGRGAEGEGDGVGAGAGGGQQPLQHRPRRQRAAGARGGVPEGRHGRDPGTALDSRSSCRRTRTGIPASGKTLSC
ncbi:Galactose oxidase/kelch repeat superfamily protein, partial [Zea mays]